MIIWGSGGGLCIAGDAGVRDCPICQSAQRFDLSVSYRYAHIWYVFSWVTHRKYLAICSRCHNGMAITKQAFQASVTKDPIPVMRRRGWLMFPAIVALVLIAGALQERQQGDPALAANYRRAVMQAIQTHWLRPDNTPASPCKVRVTLQRGGYVTGVDVEPDCPYDEAGRRSVVEAVRRADPLPYKGYEKAFHPNMVLTFVSMSDASHP